MNTEIPFHLYGEDGAQYSINVIRDLRDDANPHFDVDLVRSMTGRFGESLEQRLTLAEYDEHAEALAHQGGTEDLLQAQGLAGLGDAQERILREPMLYDGQYLFVAYPPEAEGADRAVVHLLRLDGDGVASERLAVGTADEMASITAEGERDWATGKLPNMFITPPDPERHPIGETGFTRDDSLMIHDREGKGWVSHVDGGSTSHWFAIVESEPEAPAPYELRYFRALEGKEGEFRHDSYPVMGLPDNDPEAAWPLPGLEMYLEKGDVYMAQQFAHDIADSSGMDFPPPMALPALDPRPDYYFGYGVGPHNQPSLEAVKTWMDGAERRFDTFTIAEYGMYEEARMDEQELDDLKRDHGLETAMNVAERRAAAGGYLDPHREDGRVFFEEDAPSDPFTTVRERELGRQVDLQRDLEETPIYTVNAINANDRSHLEVTKEWGEEAYAQLIIPQPDWESALTHAQFANEMLEQDQLQGGMNYVELVGIEAGVIDPKRDDPRLFTEGPPDPFTTIRERELVSPELDTPAGYPTMYAAWTEEVQQQREANAHLEGAAWFEATFEKPEQQLLQPIDDQVNYGIVVQDTDPWTLELAVEKYWKEPNGHLGIASQTIQTFDSEDETQREAAEAARQGLLDVYDERGLEGMMHRAEIAAMQSRWLDGHRADLRLFRDGPSDRFETLAQQLADEPNPYWNTTNDWPEEPSALDTSAGSWDELVAQQPDDLHKSDAHYWQMHYRPVETPEGEPLGTALFVTEFPQLPPDFDDYVEAHGMDDSLYPTEARTLEMAHFANEEDAKKFEQEFRSYLIPDLIDGPELAPEVAKLEGLSGEWQDMDYQGITDYMSGKRTIVREESDWHLHNPNAERDAQIEAEGLHFDSIQQGAERDEQASVSNTPELDF